VQAILAAVVNHRLEIRKSGSELSAADMILNQVEVPV